MQRVIVVSVTDRSPPLLQQLDALLGCGRLQRHGSYHRLLLYVH